jgi:uncharacterized protein involved in outer membrane biogenesis
MKKAAIVIAVLLAVAAGAVYLAYNSVDLIVKTALEHYAPDVMGVPVTVGEVRISPRDGLGSLKGIDIGSPKGFSAPRTARLGEIRVAIDPATLMQPVIVIRELIVEAPAITYERGDKATNLDAIQKSIAAYIQRSGGPSASRPATASPGGHKFIVERLAIRGGKVTMTTPGLRGQGVTFDLPEIDLRDVGARQGGVTASEIGNLVAEVLQQRIAQKVVTNIELLRKGGLEGALDALKGLLR